MYREAITLYGWAMSQSLLYDEIKIDRNVQLEGIWITPDDCDIGYLLQVDLTYPDNIKEKTKVFPFCPENKEINPDNFFDFMKKIKTKKLYRN